jgi:hypothetical protein
MSTMSCEEVLAEVTAFHLEHGSGRAWTGPDDLRAELREHLDGCPGCREEAEGLGELWGRLALLEAEPPEMELRERFDAVLAAYQAGMAAAGAPARPCPAESAPWWRRWLSSLSGHPARPGFQLAYAALALLVGTGVGALVLGRGVAGGEIRELRGEVRSLNELVTLSMLEDSSASDRLQGVSFGAQMDRPDRQVVAALVSAATSDPNVNVRLAAIEALAPRAGQPPIFARLVRSLPEQDSPLVQVALVDLLLETDGAAARDAALRLARDTDTDPEVRRHVRERLGNLI